MSERTYPLHGTCDLCANGEVPLREIDPRTQAWVCEACDLLRDRAVEAANTAVAHAPEGTDFHDLITIAINAYEQYLFDAQLDEIDDADP